MNRYLTSLFITIQSLFSFIMGLMGEKMKRDNRQAHRFHVSRQKSLLCCHVIWRLESDGKGIASPSSPSFPRFLIHFLNRGWWRMWRRCFLSSHFPSIINVDDGSEEERVMRCQPHKRRIDRRLASEKRCPRLAHKEGTRDLLASRDTIFPSHAFPPTLGLLEMRERRKRYPTDREWDKGGGRLNRYSISHGSYH